MALSTDIEAKSPEDAAPQEIELPSMEPVPAPHGTPGLSGLLSRSAFAIKVSLAALLLGAQMMSIGFLAELITAYSSREEDSYSIAERVGHQEADAGTDHQPSAKHE